jgi:hypothetical protein
LTAHVPHAPTSHSPKNLAPAPLLIGEKSVVRLLHYLPQSADAARRDVACPGNATAVWFDGLREFNRRLLCLRDRTRVKTLGCACPVASRLPPKVRLRLAHWCSSSSWCGCRYGFNEPEPQEGRESHDSGRERRSRRCWRATSGANQPASRGSVALPRCAGGPETGCSGRVPFKVRHRTLRRLWSNAELLHKNLPRRHFR